MSGELGTPDFKRGFMKLPHSVVRELLPDMVTLCTYVALLNRAAYKAGPRVLKGHGVIHLRVGEAVFGRKELADEIGTTERPLRRSLKVLQKVGYVSIRTSNLGSIATICGYGEITEGEGAEGPADGPEKVQQPVGERSSGTSTNKDRRRSKSKDEKTQREPGQAPGVHVLRDLWVRLVKEHRGTEYFVRGYDWKILKELETGLGVEEASKRMHIAFTAPPSWPAQPWSLSTLHKNINECAAPNAGGTKDVRVGRVEPETDPAAFGETGTVKL